MKTLVIILWMQCLFAASLFAQQGNGDKIDIPLTEVEGDDEDEEERTPSGIPGKEIEPIFMSLLLQQPYAYLYNSVIVVAFEGNFRTVDISLTNLFTGETVCDETYAYPAEVSIPLVEKGDYILRIAADGTVWEGVCFR